MRGSGRFRLPQAGGVSEKERLNPLHCGAVVASQGQEDREQGQEDVSIPFIAGQWSLRVPPATSCRGGTTVSIPFIAGQWSLHKDKKTENKDKKTSQSPSLRGSGRFKPTSPQGGGARRSLNPLHCGAVVASESDPSMMRCWPVSIPFIAGQWSLLHSLSKPLICRRLSQSPSLRGSGRFVKAGARGGLRYNVSIPFIAGQWSLLEGDPALSGVKLSQSPSLRGSGRFGCAT